MEEEHLGQVPLGICLSASASFEKDSVHALFVSNEGMQCWYRTWRPGLLCLLCLQQAPCCPLPPLRGLTLCLGPSLWYVSWGFPWLLCTSGCQLLDDLTLTEISVLMLTV